MLQATPNVLATFAAVKPANPKIDFRGIGRGLRAALLFTEAGGLARDASMVSSLGSHGTLTGAGSTFQDRGAFGGGSCYNNTGAAGACINCGSGTRIANLGPLTMLTWVNYATTPGQNLFAYKSNADGGAGWWWGVDGAGPPGNLSFFVSTSATDVGAQNATVPKTKQWTQIAVTWDGTLTASGIVFYQNGRALTGNTTQNGSGSSSSDAAISLIVAGSNGSIVLSPGLGTWSGAGADYATDGMFDHFLIWNRVLSPGEIMRLYREPTAFLLPEVVTRRWFNNPGGGTTHNISASDSPSTTDSVARTGTFNRTASDAPTTADSPTRTGTFNRTASDAPSTTDSPARALTLARTTSDAPSTTDSVVRVGTFVRSTSDAPTTTDSPARTGTFIRTTQDTPQTTDSAPRSLTLGRTAGDSPLTTDAVVRAGTFVRTTNDAPTTTDSVARTGTFNRITARLSKWAIKCVRANAQYVSLTAGAVTSGLFTIHCWIKLNSTGVVQAIYCQGTGDHLSLRVTASNNFAASFDGSNVDSGATVLSAGVWYPVGIVYSGSGAGQALLYVKGVQDGSATRTADYTHDAGRIGNFITATGLSFDGEMDDVRVYSVAKTAAQMAALAAGADDQANLIDYWAMEEGSGTSTADSAGTLTGTLTNGASWTQDVPTTLSGDAPFTTDLASVSKAKQITAADSPTTTDSVGRIGTFTRTTNDAPTTTDSPARALTLGRAAQDSPLTTDSPARLLTLGRNPNDSPTTTDSPARALTLGRAAQDSPLTTDSASRSEVLGRTAQDAPLTTDSVGRAGTFVRTTQDSPVTTDAATRTVSFVRTTADFPLTSDVPLRLLSLLRNVADTPATTDSAVGVVTHAGLGLVLIVQGLYAPTIPVQGSYSAIMAVQGSYSPVLIVQGGYPVALLGQTAKCVQGEAPTIQVQVPPATPLSGMQLLWVLKKSPTDPTPLLLKDNGGTGGVTIDTVNNYANVALASADTLRAASTYGWDLWNSATNILISQGTLVIAQQNRFQAPPPN